MRLAGFPVLDFRYGVQQHHVGLGKALVHCPTAKDMPQALLSQGSIASFPLHAVSLMATEGCQVVSLACDILLHCNLALLVNPKEQVAHVLFIITYVLLLLILRCLLLTSALYVLLTGDPCFLRVTYS